MTKFNEYRSETEILVESVEDLEKVFGTEFSDFALELSAYIDYNDKASADSLLRFYPKLRKAGLVDKPNELYRLVKLERFSDYKPGAQQITSTSTSRFKSSFLKDMKAMVNQYQKQGKFYCLIIQNAKGLDIQKLYKIFKGKKKYLINKYDSPGNMNFSSLFDSFEDKKYQKEFIIFGKYEIKEFIPV
jgi:hypothetical protein